MIFVSLLHLIKHWSIREHRQLSLVVGSGKSSIISAFILGTFILGSSGAMAKSTMFSEMTLPMLIFPDECRVWIVYPRFLDKQKAVLEEFVERSECKVQRALKKKNEGIIPAHQLNLIQAMDFRYSTPTAGRPDLAELSGFDQLSSLERVALFFANLSSESPEASEVRDYLSFLDREENQQKAFAEFNYIFSIYCRRPNVDFTPDFCDKYLERGIKLGSRIRVFYE